MDATTQLRYLLRDVRGLTWGSTTVAQALAQVQQTLAEEDRMLQRTRTFTLTAGTQTYALPSEYVDTFALVTGNFQVTMRLLDSAAVAWWLQVSANGDLGFTSSAPVSEVLLPSTDRTSLRLVSADLSVWYLFPALDGTPTVDSVAPAGTIQTQLPELRDSQGGRWYLGVTNLGDVFTTTTATASPLTGTDVTIRTLQRQEALARVHTDVTASPGIPRYYTIQGGTLFVWPAPVSATLCEQAYFAADTLPPPSPYTTVLGWEAAAWVAQATWPPDTGVALRSLTAALRARLRAIYVPGDRDAYESWQGKGV